MARVKALFININGDIYAENLPPKHRAIQFLDGAHPYVPSAVYHDIDRVGPPLAIYWHGRRDPEGVALDIPHAEAMIMESVTCHQHKIRFPISRRWWRLFIRTSVMFLKVLGLGFLLYFAVMMGLVIF